MRLKNLLITLFAIFVITFITPNFVLAAENENIAKDELDNTNEPITSEQAASETEESPQEEPNSEKPQPNDVTNDESENAEEIEAEDSIKDLEEDLDTEEDTPETSEDVDNTEEVDTNEEEIIDGEEAEDIDAEDEIIEEDNEAVTDEEAEVEGTFAGEDEADGSSEEVEEDNEVEENSLEKEITSFANKKKEYKNGDREEGVVGLKKDLTRLGFGNYPKNPSNRFGGDTERNIRTFQEYYGLKVNGIADKVTLNFIQNTLNSIYQNGNNGSHVVTLKKNLTKLGFGNYPKNPSNRFGGSTEKNVKAFQEYYDLRVNGIADQTTLNFIDSTLKSIYQNGNNGSHVVTLKKNLTKLGFGNYPKNPSNRFGGSTEKNVKKFQEYYNLRVNGIADQTTLNFIHSTLNSIYQNGNNGNHVVTLKKNLTKLGFGNYPKNPSNRFGESTEKNVKAFQEYYDLRVNGIADQTTLNFIDSTLDSIYQSGNRGSHVVTLKKKLSKLGIGNYPTNPSNRFGGSTKNNVKTFQKLHNLKVNGIADKVTLAKIDELIKKANNRKVVKIFIDPGHGGSDPGAQGHGLKEKELTLDIADRIVKYLNQYQGVEIKMSRTTDKTVSLSERTKMANDWGADYFVSVHINSCCGATGFESYIHNGNKGTSDAKEKQNIIHDQIAKNINTRDRGKKSANFHVLRESNMSAILLEYLFISTKSDNDKLRQSSFRNNLAKQTAAGIAKAFNLKK